MENKTLEKTCDIVVVGAGHAGCEAALACARLGLDTVMFTVSVDSIALMPCNPNVGGSSKGHLVKELDALGGEMGKNIDKTFIQSKMLNKSKGPAGRKNMPRTDSHTTSTVDTCCLNCLSFRYSIMFQKQECRGCLCTWYMKII